MKRFKFAKRALHAAVGLAMVVGMASAQASPVFGIDPSALIGGAPVGPIYADAIGGSSTERLITTGDTHSGGGWLTYSSFRLSSDELTADETGLNSLYRIYVKFTLEDHLVSGTIDTAGSVYQLDKLDFEMWIDPGIDNDYNSATLVDDATIVDMDSDDIQLGFGSLVVGTSGINILGGAALNANTLFTLTDLGKLFFINPVPFYDMTFNGFNNTSQGVAIGGGAIAINNASGTTDFNRVPEPGSLALLALGLLGVHAVNRRRQGA